MSPRLSSTILDSQYFRHTKKRQPQWEGLWCPNDQPPVTAAAHPQRTCRCTVHKITAQISLFGHQHPTNPTWHPSSCSHPARPWLHRLELNISSLTKGSRAPGATIFSQLGAPSRHVGTGPGAGTAARTGSAPEFYSAQQAMLLLQLP